MTQATENALRFLIENHRDYYELCFTMTKPEENSPTPAWTMGLFLGKNLSSPQSELDRVDVNELIAGFNNWENEEANRSVGELMSSLGVKLGPPTQMPTEI